MSQVSFAISILCNTAVRLEQRNATALCVIKCNDAVTIGVVRTVKRDTLWHTINL